MRPIDIIIGIPAPIPLLRKAVPAGFPSPAEDWIEEEIDLQRLLIVNRPATFMVRVAGDSMIGAHLHDGDLAIVDRSLTPRLGDVVVVDIDGDRSFKVWGQVLGGRPELRFANDRYPDYVVVSDAVIEVWGVVSSSISPGRRSGR